MWRAAVNTASGKLTVFETGVLIAECVKCTHTRAFNGESPAESLKAYRDAGWTFVKRGEKMMMVCDKCPPGKD